MSDYVVINNKNVVVPHVSLLVMRRSGMTNDQIIEKLITELYTELATALKDMDNDPTDV